MDYQPQQMQGQQGGMEQLASWIQQWAQRLRMGPEAFITMLVQNNFQWPTRLGAPPNDFPQMIGFLRQVVQQVSPQTEPPMEEGLGMEQGMFEEEEPELPMSARWRR